EGWANYCETLLSEQGFGDGDPRLALAGLAREAERIGAFITGVSIHTRSMTLDEARQFLEDRCFLRPADAARQARLETAGPTSFLAALEDLRIVELREEARHSIGPRFRLRDFHDAYLQQAGVPFPVARFGVYGELSGTTARRTSQDAHSTIHKRSDFRANR